MLANTEAVATISLGGASFEILNPRKSLDMARIVSFIEDADACSLLSIRDSKVSSNHFSLDQPLDRSSLSQFTDVSLPSHYSSQSLYTTLPRGNTPPQKQTADIPSSSPGVHDRVRSLSDYSLHEHDYWSSKDQDDYEYDEQAYPDLVEDSPKPRMASISEHIDKEESHDPQAHSQSQSPRPPSSSQPTFYSEESDIGEPGSPVYANGEWAQVDERDRGILLDLPSPTDPYNTYYTNTMSDYAKTYDPYDTIGYLDPHVQSVLAAANAENMGLRGNPARGGNDLPRKYHASISTPGVGVRTKIEGPKQSFSQRKRLRKFFSWRSGN
jgi:hypothetical protein